MIEKAQITFGGGAEGGLLASIDGFGGTAEVGGGAGADLDEDEDVAMAADEVDLAILGQIIAVEDAVAVAAKEGGGDALTIIPDLLRRREGRRRCTRGSVENRGDEWQKGREG